MAKQTLRQQMADRIAEIHELVGIPARPWKRFGLAEGYLGFSIFRYLYGLYTKDPLCFVQSAQLFNAGCDLINADRTMLHPLDFTDLGAVAQYLSEKKVLDVDAGRFLEDMDAFQLERMLAKLEENHLCGFADGAAGYGLYFMHRLRQDRRFGTVLSGSLIPGILARLSVEGDAVYGKTAAEAPDLTLAHGQAAVILLLAAAEEAGAGPDQALVIPVLQKVVACVIRHAALQRPVPAFGNGHIGTGYALLRAGKVFRREDWVGAATEVLENCARTCLSGETDISGAALAFDRIFGITGAPVFREAAAACYRQLLQENSGADRIRPFQPPRRTGFTEGVAGTGAALIRKVHGEEADFSRLIWLI